MHRPPAPQRPLLDPRDTFIDFSCGTNEFGFLLGLKWVGLGT